MDSRRCAGVWDHRERLLILNTVRRWVIAGMAAIAFVVSAGCEPRQNESPRAASERNKAFVQRWVEEGFNKRNVAIVDELFADRFAVNGQVIGRDGLKASMSQHFVGFPDLHVTIDDIVAEGYKVGFWYTVEGTHRGDFEGIAATGRRVKWSGFDLLSIEDGKISEARFLSDFLGLLTQLGATVTKPGNAAGARP
jgi:steroid delta-isomerase-like uncharacterized protein